MKRAALLLIILIGALFAASCRQPEPTPTPVLTLPSPPPEVTLTEVAEVSPTSPPTETVTLAPTVTARPTDGPTVAPIATATTSRTPTATAIVIATATVAPSPTRTSAPPPPPTLPPAPTATATPAIVITYFRAVPAEADPGQTITLEWATQGTATVWLHHLLNSLQFGGGDWQVGSEGSFTYTVGDRERNRSFFALTAYDASNNYIIAYATVLLRCPFAWYFQPPLEECALDPVAYSDAVEQHFEGGSMVWVKNQDRIYIFYSDVLHPRWELYSDEWNVGDPESDPSITPPSPALYQPVRGFGLIWRTFPSIRERLGWATTLEMAYTSAYQTTARSRYNESFLSSVDGYVYQLLPERTSWTKTRRVP
jgi:hypothetical protein